MKNIFALVGLAVVAVFIWSAFQGNSTDYVATMSDEIATLESELASIEVLVASGSMTPAEAATVQLKITERLEAINGSIEGSQKMTLTVAQMSQLQTGLERLKQLLTDYRATLTVVDEAVQELPEAERPRRSGGSGRVASIIESISQTIEAVEDHVEGLLDEAFGAEVNEDEIASNADMTDESEATSDDATTEEEDVVEARDETEDASADLGVEVSTEFQFGSGAADDATEDGEGERQ